MEGKDRYDRTGNPEHRSHYRNNERRVDEDRYRGAYRFDNSSDHRNVSTWDWNSNPDRSRSDYNRDYNQNYNRDYNRNYNSDSRRAGGSGSQRNNEKGWSGGYDHDNYNTDSRYRNQDQSYRTSNSSDWNRPHNEEDHGQHSYRSVRSRMDDRDRSRGAGSNFNADYAPDNYGRGGGENYGNMAGSLSFGYDGTSNYDPDWNRHYDPLSGHRQSYHGNYTSRHPESYRGSSNRSDDDYKNRY